MPGMVKKVSHRLYFVARFGVVKAFVDHVVADAISGGTIANRAELETIG